MKTKKQKGFTLIELVIGVGIFAIIILAAYTLFSTVYNTNEANRMRSLATEVASQEMEIIRNMDYNDIGTVSGNPSGNIQNLKTVTVGNADFNVETYISWHDDDYDFTAETGDSAPNDYKRVRISVCWTNLDCPTPVVMTSDFASQQIESAEGKGTLKVTVLSANGNPVPEAKVEFFRNGTGEYFYGYTDTNGILIEPNLEPGIDIYHVAASKEGHSNDSTITPQAGVTPPSPDRIDPSVIAGEVNPRTLFIDRTSTMNITTTDKQTGDPIGNIWLNLKGEKNLGTNDDDGTPVYKFDVDVETDENGLKNLTDMEWDTYHLLLTAPSSEDYTIGGINTAKSIVLDPNTTLDVAVFLVPYSEHSLLVNVQDVDTEEIIEEATVRLQREEDEYDEEQQSTDYGQAFFRDLNPEEYQITITKEGYDTIKETITIDGTMWEIFEMARPE